MNELRTIMAVRRPSCVAAFAYLLIVLAVAATTFAADRACEGRFIYAACQEGKYPSPDRKATALLRSNEIRGIRVGGFLVLTLTEKEAVILRADDVTGLLWLNSKTLAYSTEQAYGEPALWTFTVGQPKPRAIMRNPNNPYKTDSNFELIGGCAGPAILFFSYDYTGLANGKSHLQLFSIDLDRNRLATTTLDPSIIRRRRELCPQRASR